MAAMPKIPLFLPPTVLPALGMAGKGGILPILDAGARVPLNQTLARALGVRVPLGAVQAKSAFKSPNVASSTAGGTPPVWFNNRKGADRLVPGRPATQGHEDRPRGLGPTPGRDRLSDLEGGHGLRHAGPRWRAEVSPVRLLVFGPST